MVPGSTRGALIAAVAQHAAEAAASGDLEAAGILHDAMGKLLLACARAPNSVDLRASTSRG